MASLLFDAQLAQVARELEAAEPVRSAIPAFEAFTLCAALQLAWRHPGLSNLQRAIIEKATRDLQEAIGRRSPTARELLEDGWVCAFDLPVGVDRG